MPDNPDVKDLVARAAKVRDAQAQLRTEMAKVAAEVAATRNAPPPPPAAPPKG